jgi:hypothetical protein
MALSSLDAQSEAATAGFSGSLLSAASARSTAATRRS